MMVKCGQMIHLAASDVHIQCSFLLYVAKFPDIFGAKFFHQKLPWGVESLEQTLKVVCLADLVWEMSAAKKNFDTFGNVLLHSTLLDGCRCLCSHQLLTNTHNCVWNKRIWIAMFRDINGILVGSEAQWQYSVLASVTDITQICRLDRTWHTVLTFGKDNWLFNSSCQDMMNRRCAVCIFFFSFHSHSGSIARRCSLQLRGFSTHCSDCSLPRLTRYIAQLLDSLDGGKLLT